MENPHNLREAEDMTNKLDDKEFVHYLIDLGLLNSNQICNCGRIMSIELDYSSNDGVAWKCTSPICRKYKSVKKGSVFENSKYNLRLCFRIYSAWVANFRPKDIAQYIGVNDTHGICRLCKIFREMACSKYQQDINDNLLGSTGGIVQVDESATGRAKYHCGRALKRECAWVVGAVDDDTNRIAVEQVPDRTQETLSAFICKSVQNKSTVHSDCWRGYNNLISLGFDHDTVNHKEEFVKENDDGSITHTQKIEGNWTSMKKFVNHHSAHRRIYTDSYIKNWAFRRNIGNQFEKCFDVLKKT